MAPVVCCWFLLFNTITLHAQLNLLNGAVAYNINFDNTVADVNNGTLSSIVPVFDPPAGQLEEASWNFTGSTFGGQSNGTVSLPGWYAFQVNPGNRALGCQATSGFDYHDVSLLVANKTSLVISSLTITYKVYAGDPQGRSSTINFSGSSGTGATGSETTDNIFSTGTAATGTWRYLTKTTTITGLAIPNNGTYTLKWAADRGTGSGNADEWALDDISITATTTPCSVVAAPATNASGLSFTNVGCDRMTLQWTAPVGTNTLIIAGTTGSLTSPVNGTSYISSSTFGEGTAVAPGEFVVYNGSANACSVYGLTASTDYSFRIISFNGNGSCVQYNAGAGITATHTTSGVCSTCPVITGIVVDACNTVCGEGDNEIIFMNSGSYALNVSPASFVVNYNLANSAPLNYTSGITTNSATIAALNSGTINTCAAGTFIDAAALGTIPPNADIMVVRNTFCPSEYNFSSLCASGPIYVVFSTSAYWTAGGNFGNNGSSSGAPSGADRYFQLDFTGLNPDCKINYQYSSYTLYNGNGAFITPIDPGKGVNVTYSVTGSCNLMSMLLPVELLSFEGTGTAVGNVLRWTTASEDDILEFVIEHSTDDAQYTLLSSHASCCFEGATYATTDDHPSPGLNYYRLSARSTDGTLSTLRTLALQRDEYGKMVEAYVATDGIRVMLHPDLSAGHQPMHVEVLDSRGRLLVQRTSIGERLFVFDAEQLPVGVYIIRVAAGGMFFSEKVCLVSAGSGR